MWLWPLLLCLPLSLALSGLSEPEVLEDDDDLDCGPQGLRYTVHPPGQETETPQALIVWDDHGLLHPLQNDSGCGTQVTEGPGSSMVLEAAYGSCYVSQWNSYHIMPVGVEGTDAAGHRTVAKTRLLRCPVGLPALTAPGADLCESVPLGDRLPCAPAPTTQGDCKVLGCCYNASGRSCYYGNTVTSHCTQDGHFSIAVALNVTSPPLLLNSVHMAFSNDSECDPVMTTQAFALFRFPFTACGTTRWIAGDQAVYENELEAAREVRTWSRGSITRESTFRLRVHCTYTISSNALPVNVQVVRPPLPQPETQPGPLTLELQIARDENYSSYYSAGDYPVVKLLRDPIYVEVSVRHRTDPNLRLLLHHCWATPSPDPLHQLQWPLLVKGCPYTGDNYWTHLIPVPEARSVEFPSHSQRFSIFTFSFVDSEARLVLRGPVYLHCSVSLCQPAGTLSCVTCPVARRRRSPGVPSGSSTADVSSRGPMVLLQAPEEPSEKLPKYSGPPAGSHALWVAGLSGTLAVGVLLVSYLATKKRR